MLTVVIATVGDDYSPDSFGGVEDLITTTTTTAITTTTTIVIVIAIAIATTILHTRR